MSNPEVKKPDATPENTNTGVDYEKRFKDTQGAYTKSQQELKQTRAKLEALEKLTTPSVELDAQTKEELDGLKYENPDAWRAKMNSLEAEAKRKHNEVLSEAAKEASLQAEMEHRVQVLNSFNESHPDMVLTDEVIKYDVPPRITKRLEDGEVTFEAYLEEVANYLQTPKVVGDGNKTLEQPNLGKVGGDDKPSDNSVKKDIVKDYKNIVF